MIFRTLIVDDEPPARRLIRKLLAGDTEIKIVGECADGKSAVREISRLKPDLVFLDVQMPGLSGFEVIEKLIHGQAPCIVFVTAYDQYALKAFEACALDYLLKPFEKERFYVCLKRAKLAIRKDNLSAMAEKLLSLAQEQIGGRNIVGANAGHERPYLAEIVLREGSRIKALKISNIIWFEAANQYVRAHTEHSSHLISKSLSALEGELDPELFFRIHRSAIVNIAFVGAIKSAPGGSFQVELSSGEAIDVSRRRRAALQRLLKRHS